MQVMRQSRKKSWDNKKDFYCIFKQITIGRKISTCDLSVLRIAIKCHIGIE